MTICHYTAEGNSPALSYGVTMMLRTVSFAKLITNYTRSILRNKMAIHLRDYHEVALQLEHLQRMAK